MEYKHGKMEINIQEIGKKIKKMDKELIYYKMVINMKANGKMIK